MPEGASGHCSTIAGEIIRYSSHLAVSLLVITTSWRCMHDRAVLAWCSLPPDLHDKRQEGQPPGCTSVAALYLRVRQPSAHLAPLCCNSKVATCIPDSGVLVQVHNPGPAWVSMSCKDGMHTNHGEHFARDCLPIALLCPSLVAVGINCTPPNYIKQLLQSSRWATVPYICNFAVPVTAITVDAAARCSCNCIAELHMPLKLF